MGISFRIAGKLAGQRLAGSVPGAAHPATGSTARQRPPVTIEGVINQVTTPEQRRAAGRTAGRATGSVARGVSGFFRPFRRLGGIIFLEVAGVFFFVFVLVFGQMVYRLRASAMAGPDHQKFLVATALLAVFLYLSVSSFWRARHK